MRLVHLIGRKPTKQRFALALAVCGAFAACGPTAQPSFIFVNSSGGSGAHAIDGGLAPITGGGLAPIILGEGGLAPAGPLAIAPLASVLTVVTGAAVPTRQFTTSLGEIGVSWSIEQGYLGTIDASGLFTPSGTAGGVATIVASAGGQTATTTITVNVQTTDVGDPAWTPAPGDPGAGGYGGVGGDGPGAPARVGQMATLNGAPALDPAVSILYPYDGTVWPQGLLAPLLQWNPGPHSFDSVYVRIQEKNFVYKGYFAANTAGPFVNVPIPQRAWSTMAFSNAGEQVLVSLTFAQGANAFGPYTETWTIAQATLQGTIYYNSYGTALVKNSDTPDSYGNQYGAGTLAIRPGATAPTLVAGVSGPEGGDGPGGCRVCHTVAANGESLVTQASTANGGNYSATVTVNLANNATGGAGAPLATPNLAYPALYKDGSMLFAGAGGMINSGGASGTSGLYAVPAGTPIAGVTGLPPGFEAALPAFSPDGAHIAFNFWAGSFGGNGGWLSGDQVSLAMLDFNGARAFSNSRVLFTPPAGTAVTYSSFFPNDAGIVFEIELSNPTSCWGYTWNAKNRFSTGNTAELWWVDVASGQAHRLDALNGGPPGAPYLPSQPVPAGGASPAHTPALDVTLNYEPTVNPIASGGYAWVVFMSRRMYGNVAQLDPWASDPRFYPWQDEVTDKKLWVAAVDLNAAPGTDPSHPAFYLPAQEIHAGNARGYWTVDPCRANGQSCVTGDQCCGGFCELGADGGLQCTAQAPTCAGEYDKCETTNDCCAASSGIQCVNGVCTEAAPK
jgi:hypothetical protein